MARVTNINVGGTNYDIAHEGELKNSGFEVVTSLPTTGLFAGREVMYNGKKYVYSSGWKEEITANTMYEANLLWGGRNISDSFSPVDAGMMSELSANVMAFPNPAGISIEYSRDGGVTWLDYEATDEQKVRLFTDRYSFICGKGGNADSPLQLRVTITPMECGLYVSLNKIIMIINSRGIPNCKCTFKVLTGANVDAGNEDDSFYETIINKAEISGNPGYNVLNFGTIYTKHITGPYPNFYHRLRLIFEYEVIEGSTKSALTVTGLRFFGIHKYILPSNLASNNHLYAYDWKQNALFPAKVESKELINFDVNNIEPTQTGSSVSKTSTWLWQYLVQAVNWLKANNVRLSAYNTKVAALEQADSDNNASIQSVSTDLTELSNGLATVATSGSYNDLIDNPTQLPNPNPIIIKTADGVSVRYDGSTSGGVTLEAGNNAELTATQDSNDTMTVKFGAVVPQTLPNPNALNIMVSDSEGALLGPSIVYDGVATKYINLIEGYGITLSNSNLSTGQAITINLKQIAGTTLLGNANDTIGIPQAVTMTQLRTMLGSLTLNDIDVTLGGNNSYTLPCYIDYNGVDYPARIRDHWLQIYRNGIWANTFYLLSNPPTECRYITDLSDPSWYDESVTEYELDSMATEQLLLADSSTNIANWIKAINANQITFNSSVIASKDKGKLDNIIRNLKDNGYSVFVENDIDTILSSGNDWVISIKIKRFNDTYKAIIECYVAR